MFDVLQECSLLDGLFVSEADETTIGHGDELVQHHARHVTLGQVRQSSALAKLDLEEGEVLLGGVGDVVVGEHHTLGVPSGAGGVADHAALVDSNVPQSLIQNRVRGVLTCQKLKILDIIQYSNKW